MEDASLENMVLSQYINQSGILKTKTKIGSDSNNQLVVVSEHGDLLTNSGLNSSETNIRNKTIEYVIQSGDTLSNIANNFGLNVNTILWENNLSSNSLIKPGTKLTILPSNGIVHAVAKNENISKIASKYGVTNEAIIDNNDIYENETLTIGQKLFIPGGKKIIEKTTIVNRSYSGTTITQNTNNSDQKPAYTGGKLLWPTVGSRITQYYSWRHKGLDIANKTGTPLYAAESGVVERSGWNNGYGYNVIINHGGGLKTLYGHASKLHVKAGDKVSRGDIIANMGSTGWSTGPHIHFEVKVNGVQQNPLNYIK